MRTHSTWQMKPVDVHWRTHRLNFLFFLFLSSLSVQVVMNTGSSSIRGSWSTYGTEGKHQYYTMENLWNRGKASVLHHGAPLGQHHLTNMSIFPLAVCTVNIQIHPQVYQSYSMCRIHMVYIVQRNAYLQVPSGQCNNNKQSKPVLQPRAGE